MASILSLPDEVLEMLGEMTEQHQGIKAWCRLTSTCRRLWMLQLPYSYRGCTLSSDYEDGIDIEGKLPRLKLVPSSTCRTTYICLPRQPFPLPLPEVAHAAARIGCFDDANCELHTGLAWALHRVHTAPSLEVSIFDLEYWYCKDPKSRRQCISRLLERVEAAAAASRKLHCLRFLVNCNSVIAGAKKPQIPLEQDLPATVGGRPQSCGMSSIDHMFEQCLAMCL